MSKMPTEEQIRKWAEDEKKAFVRNFSKERVRNKIGELLQQKVFNEIIASSLGLKYSNWSGYEVPYDFDKNSVIRKEIKEKTDPIITNILKELIKDYQFSKQDIQQIKSAYRKGFIETCKSVAYDLGIEDGEKRVTEILKEVIEKEE